MQVQVEIQGVSDDLPVCSAEPDAGALDNSCTACGFCCAVSMGDMGIPQSVFLEPQRSLFIDNFHILGDNHTSRICERCMQPFCFINSTN